MKYEMKMQSIWCYTAAPPGFRFGAEEYCRGSASSGVRVGDPDARKFWKFPKNFARKLQKMDYFRRFFKKLKTLRSIFAVCTKNTTVWEIFEKIFKFFFENSTKRIILVYFQNNFITSALKFRAFWRKP